MDSNFDDVPTEILDEEINRRRAVIDFRKEKAEALLTKVAEGLHAPTHGVSYAMSRFFRLVACFSLFAVAMVSLVIVIFSSQPSLLLIGGFCFLASVIQFLLLSKEHRRVTREFLRRYPEEAKLLGYKK